jgi:hypothetical protein
MERTVSAGVDVPVTTVNGRLTVPVCRVHPGETVRWKVDNRRVSIWFPTAGVFPAPALAVQKSDSIDVVVPRTARPGRYQYVIYCHDTDEFATCEPHPIMEVLEP